MTTHINAPETAVMLGESPIQVSVEQRVRELKAANVSFNRALRKVGALRKRLKIAEEELRERKSFLSLLIRDASQPVMLLPVVNDGTDVP